MYSFGPSDEFRILCHTSRITNFPISRRGPYSELVGLGGSLDAVVRFATLAEFAGSRRHVQIWHPLL